MQSSSQSSSSNLAPDSLPRPSQSTDSSRDVALSRMQGDPDVEMRAATPVESDRTPGPSKPAPRTTKKPAAGPPTDYSIVVDGKKVRSAQVRKMLAPVEGEIPKTKEDVEYSNALAEAEHSALLGYVLMDVIDPEQRMLPGYINGRPVDNWQATLLQQEFKTHGCRSTQYHLIAAIDSTDAFVDEHGQPVQCSPSPQNAPKVKLRPGFYAWRIAGGHRTEAVIKEWKDATNLVAEKEALHTKLTAGAVQSTIQGKDDLPKAEKAWTDAVVWLDKVNTQWRWWLVKIFSRSILNADTGVMAAVRVDLGDNRRVHHYEGTPREKFHMLVLAPKAADTSINQQMARLWESRAFRLIIDLWVHFASMPEVDSLEIGVNERRIHEPWFGVWALLVAESFTLLQNAVQPPENDRDNPFISSTYYSIFNSILHDIFDTAYNSKLRPVLLQETVCNPDGNATKEWTDAALLYYSVLLRDLNGQCGDIGIETSAQPMDWSKHRTDALQQLIGAVQGRTARIADYKSKKEPVPFHTTIPFFCNSAAKDYVRLAQQVGPGLCVLAELLEPAYRNFRPGGLPKATAATRTNRKPYDLPDEALLLKFQAEKRMGRFAESPEGRSTWTSFFHRLVFAGWGCSLSARVINLGLRAFDCVETPPPVVPGKKLLDYITPPDPAPTKSPKAPRPPTLSMIKKGVLNYVRGKLVAVANNPLRENLAPDKKRDWSGYATAGTGYSQYVPHDFGEWLGALVGGNSYFSKIAHAIPVNIDDHLNACYSVFRFLESSQKASLERLVPTPEFQVIWSAWNAFSELGGMHEAVWYHALVDVTLAPSADNTPVRTTPFLICFSGEVFPQPNTVTDEDKSWKEAHLWTIREARARRRQGRTASAGDDEGTSESDNGQTDSNYDDGLAQAKARKGKGKAKAEPTASTRPKRKRESAGDVSTQPAAKKGTPTDSKPDTASLSKAVIADSDSEATLVTLQDSDDPLERQCGWSLRQLDGLLSQERLDVMGVHNGFSASLGRYALNGLSLDLCMLLRGLEWSVLLALATYGKSSHLFWLPATTKTMEPNWEKAVNAFNAEATGFRIPPHEALSFLNRDDLRGVGFLPIRVSALQRLRKVTQTTLAKWAHSTDLPSLPEVTKSLVDAMVRDSQSYEAAVPMEIVDVDSGKTEQKSSGPISRSNKELGDDDVKMTEDSARTPSAESDEEESGEDEEDNRPSSNADDQAGSGDDSSESEESDGDDANEGGAEETHESEDDEENGTMNATRQSAAAASLPRAAETLPSQPVPKTPPRRRNPVVKGSTSTPERMSTRLRNQSTNTRIVHPTGITGTTRRRRTGANIARDEGV